jgi:anthranilate synthase component 1
MIYPDLNQARIISEGYDLVPIAMELMADMMTPIQLFQALKTGASYCFLLESVENGEKWGRYSFIGTHPKDELILKRGRMKINDKAVMSEGETLDPFKIIEDFLSTRRCPKLLNLPPLTGGLVGYFGYDAARYVENTLGEGPENVLETPDIHLNYYEEVIAFDHLKHKVILTTHVKTEGDFESQYHEGIKRLEARSEALFEQICNSAKLEVGANTPMRMKTPDLSAGATSGILSNTTKEAFMEKVVKAKQHLYDGDAFQIVLSQRFEALNPPPAFDVYRMLRVANPSPYMFYFKFPGYEIAGASPERMVSVTDGRIMTKPIAGTIRRGVDEEEDKRFEAQLLNDPKERAEHLMLVDLGRNDVGRVAEFGSVEVTTLMKVERYSKVMHLVSEVEGDLKSGLNCVDALKSVLPAGTLSGAPKVRAMEIIDSLETDRRGLYGGTAGYLALNGDMDTCIAIRTALFKGGKAYIQAGAGIVADSVPEREYDETIGKAGAVLNALMEAGRLH